MSEENTGNEEQSPGDLRKLVEKRGKELETALAELNQLRSEKRSRDVGEILKAKGLTDKHAQFYTAEDVSKDAVEKWADENAALFGVKPAPSGASSGASAEQSAMARINSATTDIESLPAPDGQRMVFGDPEAISHALRTLPYDELVKQGYMPKSDGLYSRPSGR